MVTYNFLNLPDVLTKDANNYIRCYYDASGAKVKQRVTTGGNTTVRYYFNGFEYDNSKGLNLIHMDEGVINVSSNATTFKYEYFLKDHLGNTRVAFQGKDLQGGVEILQTVSYYPFGLVMKKSEFGLPASLQTRYLYNGKELNPDKMTSEALEWYDYGARFYDPQIGRFHSIDPLMEWHFNYTPYHYTCNNPINYFDPFGLDTVKSNSSNPIKKGDVVVGPDGTSSTAGMDEQKLGEVTVSVKGYGWLRRFLRKIRRALEGGNSTYEKGGGIEFTSEFNAGGNENSTARNPDAESVNIDLIMALKPNAGPKSFGFDPLGPAKGVSSASKAIKEAKVTSDREIVEGTTGTAEKTDAHGNSIDNTVNNYGKTEADSIVEPLLVIDYEDSASVRDWKINKGSRAGRPISKPYTIKKNK